LGPFLVYGGEGCVDEPFGSTKRVAFGTEPRKRRSPKGQSSPKAALGNPSQLSRCF